jgi:hypothetical protein
VIADASQAGGIAAAVDRDPFPKDIVIADLRSRDQRGVELKMLRSLAQDDADPDVIAPPQRDWPDNRGPCPDAAIWTDLGRALDQCEWTDFHAIRNLCLRIDQCCRMNSC